MSLYGRPNTRVSYRFQSLDQAKAHVHAVGSRAFFFCRDEKVRLLSDAPVCLSFSFESPEITRLLHGQVALPHGDEGSWVEIHDVRPLRMLTEVEAARRAPRMGCDAPVQVRGKAGVAHARMLDLSESGARFTGVTAFEKSERLELRLLSDDGLTFHDLPYAYVVWAGPGEMGVQFDLTDRVDRMAVRRLIAETEELWSQAWTGEHPAGCCAGNGLLEPELPAALATPGAPLARIAKP